MNIDKDDLQIKLETSKNSYKSYRLCNGNDCIGRIVLECYNNIWNLELMDVVYSGQGYGTVFLSKVLTEENLRADLMTVCPTSVDSARFFKRNGFAVSNV